MFTLLVHWKAANNGNAKAGSKWCTAWCIFFSRTNWQMCLKHCFEAKTCKLEAFSVCCFEFLLLDFGSPPPLLSFIAVVVLLFLLFCKKNKNLCTWGVKFCLISHGCLLGFFSLQCCKVFFRMFWLDQECSDSLPALFSMCMCKHGCAQAVVELVK